MDPRHERVVLKFGGSSVSSPERIAAVARRISRFWERGSQVIVVVSAMGDTTDRLLKLALRTAPGGQCLRELDQLLATGEQQSIALVAMALQELGVESLSFSGAQAGISASGRHCEGRIRSIDPDRLLRSINEGMVPVVAGFQAQDEVGDVITLGRGGSDLSAIAVAAAVKADVCYIFTDVDGIYTADPRVVEKARKLDYISWDECLEMTVAGAQVLQARSVEMAIRSGVNVCVASSDEEKEGTWIMKDCVEERAAVRAVSQDDDAARVAFDDTIDPCRVARALSERGIVAQIVVQGGRAVFLIRRSLLDETLAVCRELNASGLSWDDGLSRVSVVGVGLVNHPEISSQILSVLEEIGVAVEMFLSSALSMTCVIRATHSVKAVRALHGKFLEGGIVLCA
ncbi:MAG: aspartate kinase [Dethiosulfovibrio peptidovorans]|nr:MAG: aspartate kinase [Dethiosulfovibrio peptidovorans]